MRNLIEKDLFDLERDKPVRKDPFGSVRDTESKIWWLKEELEFIKKSLTKMLLEYTQVSNRAEVLRNQIKELGEQKK